MEERIIRLENFALDAAERIARMEARLEQTATKADLAAAVADLVKWMVGTAIVLGATGITVITFVLNNATPKAPVIPPAPIVIQVPAPAAAH
jgi:Asp/Glu/hydantoin racemase